MNTELAAAPHQGRLFRRYTLYISLLVSLGVLTSGGLGAWFAYREGRDLIDQVQRVMARSAAQRIEQFIDTVEQQMKGAAVSGRATASGVRDAQYLELLRLLRIAPSISNAAWLDAEGREQVRVSRLEPDRLGSGISHSGDASVRQVLAGEAFGRGSLTLHHDSEPHLGLAMRGERLDDGLILVEVNLRFVSEVIAAIQRERSGTAYVVDKDGSLIVHADSGLALRLSNLAGLPQVRAALAPIGDSASERATTVASIDGGASIIAAHARIDSLGWHVIVEQPLSDAFAPLVAAGLRTGALLVLGVILALAASFALARRLTAPIQVLQRGAERIGSGQLGERVEITSGDELQALASQFNRMASALQTSYGELESKVNARTMQLDEANRAKSRFLAVASHDLRQPVHALGLFVAQLQACRDEAARIALIGKVAACSTAVSDLIEVLLDISKLDAGGVVARPMPFALQPLFERFEQAYAATASEKELRLRVRATPVWVNTDPLLFERIMLNLGANAIRYTAEGGVILSARVRGERVAIEIRDTGIGIAPEHQRRVFEEFYRVEAPPDREDRGLGLGLAIVDRLATLLGLPLRVRSRVGAGSTFTVDVPRAEPTKASISASALSVLMAPARFEGLSVLVIDDDPAARESIAGLLVQWGCVVACAATGQEAMVQVSPALATPALLICDYRLGHGETGTAVVARLRAQACRDIPAVILTADATGELRGATSEAGLHLLHKPLNAARLRAVLMHVVGVSPAAA
jgi:signal transduction histidine kinase/ActR/RegA family two-component response regulator